LWQVVPRGLRSLLDSDYGDYSAAGATINAEIEYMKAAINTSFIEYERMAEAGKGLIWDVERLHMIIQARRRCPAACLTLAAAAARCRPELA